MKTRWISSQSIRSVGLLFCLAAVLGGCSKKFDLRKNIPWGEGKLDGKETPGRLVAFWSDTILHKDGQATRGFGGRLMFQERDNTDPIKVDGMLEVYAFDETHRDPTNVKPDRKYVFLADQLQEHYSKGKAGHSYSFWLPWDAAGGEAKEISIIARFTPKNGGIIISDQTRHLLPGTVRQMETIISQHQVMPRTPAATQSSHDEILAGNSKSMKTDSIAVPAMLGRQMLQHNASSNGQNVALTGANQGMSAQAQNALSPIGLPPVAATPAPVQQASGIQPMDSSQPQIQQTQFQQTSPQFQPLSAGQPILNNQLLPAQNSSQPLRESSQQAALQPNNFGSNTPGRDAFHEASRTRVVGGPINQIDQDRQNPWGQYGIASRFRGDMPSTVTPTIPTIGVPSPAMNR